MHQTKVIQGNGARSIGKPFLQK